MTTGCRGRSLKRRPCRVAGLLGRVVSLWTGLSLVACGSGPIAPADATASETGNPEGGPASVPDSTNGSADATPEPDGMQCRLLSVPIPARDSRMRRE
jgi:hypothetical protein